LRRLIPILLVLTGCASAFERMDFRRWRWAVDLDMSARYASNVEHWRDTSTATTPATPIVHQGTGRLELRGLAGRKWWSLALGVDVELGFEVPGAFVYGVHLMPVGAALRLGRRTWLGVMGGAGLGGVTERVPFAGEFPVEAFFSMDLGRWVRFMASGRATWIAGAASRDSGSMTLPFADEAEAGAGFAFGKAHDEYEARWSDGTYVGLFAREQEGGRIIGIVLAIPMDGASARTESRAIPE
jgi:hypothetical protein